MFQIILQINSVITHHNNHIFSIQNETPSENGANNPTYVFDTPEPTVTTRVLGIDEIVENQEIPVPVVAAVATAVFAAFVGRPRTTLVHVHAKAHLQFDFRKEF